MKPDISRELKICPTFKLTPELELDRRLLEWANRGGMMEGSFLWRVLRCSERQYWEAVARLHYLGIIKFSFESDPDWQPLPGQR